MIIPAGYRLRVAETADIPAYIELMIAAGFSYFTDEYVQGWLLRALPDGWFVIEHTESGALVATAMATHGATDLHPYGGELGWVAADSAHAGKGLGRAVCAAVVRRILSAGYHRIYLKTDDWRLPALKIYLQLGFVPYLFTPEMAARWQAVCETLGWTFTPEMWPSG